MNSKEKEHFARNLSSAERKKVISKLAQRINDNYNPDLYDEGKPTYNELAYLTFQDMCSLLDELHAQEEIAKPVPWPLDAHKIYPRKFGAFRLFLSPLAYQVLCSSEKTEGDDHVYQFALQIASGNYPDWFDLNKQDGSGMHSAISELSSKIVWTKEKGKLIPDKWEGFILIYHSSCPTLRFFHPDDLNDIKELQQRCLEINVS